MNVLAAIENLKSTLANTPKFRKGVLRRIDEQNAILRSGLQTAEQQLEVNRQILRVVNAQQAALENIRLASMLPLREEIASLIGTRQLGLLETVERIRDQRLSFARFGDGELRLMFRPEFDIKFQKNSARLTAELQEVLSTPSQNLLLGMPHIFGNAHWSGVFAELWHFIAPALPAVDSFGDSHVTRPLFFSFHGHEGVDAWRSVWAGREAAVLAGQGSRFELIPQLFDTLAGFETIESLPAHAFADIDRVVEKTLETGKDLALIALGPAGTIVANRLNVHGIQAIDIGHIAASYRNVFRGELFPEEQPISS
ncbi:GT-D fold domain-containing glycosyltransferase [Paeniglutamicibacter psychrophenolicus]|uniref:GT-D fold domain-containing glycosyltransferase n=1 Tax=Paeniglutamicibacter psychrophenolicus TaxID=257454 RepID=UPI00277E79C4|nr:GT-D fold domain-containing glycosyltransferase [Paeniglutamicibacter psychrophenolicus]MDQ0096136.1 hypothetical protein [Paeniglutamicibacter psychrophenolicus]